MYVNVKLQSGREVRVYAPPMSKIMALSNRKHPYPDVPVVTDVSGTGEEISMQIDDDPAYMAKLREVDEARSVDIQELTFLFALKDENPPDDFNAESFGAEMRYLNPDWKPRDGPMGRKLDWIEYVLLASTADQIILSSAINEMSTMDMEEVEAIRANFRTQMEG